MTMSRVGIDFFMMTLHQFYIDIDKVNSENNNYYPFHEIKALEKIK